MNLKLRQADDIHFTVTNVKQTSTTIEIDCEGPGGRYGSVFCSYRLESFDAEKGFCQTTGRGFPDEGPMLHGNAVGLWRRKGEKIEIKQVVDINNGDQNLDLIVIDLHAKTVRIRPFVLETITGLD